MQLSKRLKRARDAIGETQAEFCKRFVVGQAVYNRWETGEREPREPSRSYIDNVLKEFEVLEQEPVR